MKESVFVWPDRRGRRTRPNHMLAWLSSAPFCSGGIVFSVTRVPPDSTIFPLLPACSISLKGMGSSKVGEYGGIADRQHQFRRTGSDRPGRIPESLIRLAFGLPDKEQECNLGGLHQREG